MVGRPKLPDSDQLTRLNLRVKPAALDWLHAISSQRGVAYTELAREMLSRGRACEEGRCPHALRSAEKGHRVNELLEAAEQMEMELKALRSRPSLAVVNPTVAAALSPDPLEPPPDDPVPASSRWPTRGALGRWAANLSDAQLTARGVCPLHNCAFEECAQEHEWSS